MKQTRIDITENVLAVTDKESDSFEGAPPTVQTVHPLMGAVCNVHRGHRVPAQVSRLLEAEACLHPGSQLAPRDVKDGRALRAGRLGTWGLRALGCARRAVRGMPQLPALLGRPMAPLREPFAFGLPGPQPPPTVMPEIHYELPKTP